MLTVKELLYIKLVAQERSFSSAAKRAKISQPALSAAIAKAEGKLGSLYFIETVIPLMRRQPAAILQRGQSTCSINSRP